MRQKLKKHKNKKQSIIRWKERDRAYVTCISPKIAWNLLRFKADGRAVEQRHPMLE